MNTAPEGIGRAVGTAKAGDPEERLSMLLGIPSPDVASLAISAGYGSVILDCEHGFPTGEIERSMVVATHSAGGRCFVRIPLHAVEEVGGLADIGVDGIVLSNPERVGDMAGVISRVSFAPSGSRSVNPFVPAAGVPGNLEELHASAHSLELWAMAENSRFLKALQAMRNEEAVEVRPWSGIIVGPYDLAADLGCEPTPDDTELQAAVGDYVQAAKAVGIAWGLFVRDAEALDRWRALDLDPDLVVMGYDRDVWFRACQQHVLESRGSRGVR